MNGQQFIDALHQLEDSKDAQSIATLFHENAEVTTPHVKNHQAGRDGEQHFWQQYRAAFNTIHSNFLNVIEVDSTAVLEWESEATLNPGDQAVTYCGVSIVQWDESDRIIRFAAYFDTDDLRVESS